MQEVVNLVKDGRMYSYLLLNGMISRDEAIGFLRPVIESTMRQRRGVRRVIHVAMVAEPWSRERL